MKDFGPCLKGVWRLLRTVRWKVLLSAFLQTVAAAASLAFVWFSKRVVDIATGLTEGDLGLGIGLLIGIMVLQVLTRIFVKYYEGRITILAKNKIRSDVFEKALRSTWTGKDKFHSADMANRMEEDIRVITEFICCDIPTAFVTVVQMIAAVVMLFIFSSSLAWILIWIMPVAVVGARLYFRRMRALTTEIRTIDGRINGHLQETLQHRVLVKTLGSIGASEDELSELQELERSRTVSRLGYSALSRGFMSVGFSAGYLVAFIWGVLGLRDGSVTYGLMVAFLQMVGQVQRPVANLALYIPAFIRSLSSEERLLEIGELPQEGLYDDVMLDGAPGVRVTDLTFAYEGRVEPVLSGLNFDFLAGKMTVIVGPTGEGKSTLAQLLLALLEQYYPDKCEVIRPQMGRPNQVVLSVSSLEEAEEQIQSCANYAPESISVSFDEESTIEDLLGFEEKYAVHEDKSGAELRFASMMNTGNTFCYSLSHDSERTFVLRFLSYSVGYLAYLDMQTWLRCFSDEAFSQRIQEFWTVNILPLQGAEKDDYTKAREAMQLLCDNASYDWEERDSIVNGQGSFRPEAHSLSGFLSSGKIVCDGYAKAYQWILKCMGIDCLLVYGKSMPSEEGHAWNKVKIGENWFNADVCWRDTGSGDMYFLKSDDFFQNNWHQYRDTYVLTSFASLSSYSLW